MPSVTERPTPPDGTLIKPTNVTTTTAYINNQKATLVVQDVDGNAIETTEQPVSPPAPRYYSGTEEKPSAAYLSYVDCCHCKAKCLEGQRVCLECAKVTSSPHCISKRSRSVD